MNKRPVSVAIAGSLMLLVGVGSLAGMLILLSRSDLKDSMTRSGATTASYAISFLGIVITLSSGICVFLRQNWARWLFMGWSVFSLLLSSTAGGFSARMLPSTVFVVVVGLLLTVGVGDYFRKGKF